MYFACDTALFLDMKLIGSGGLDLAVLPIGDLYTMGPDDSIDAIKLLNPKRVAPCHYNTWPPIAQDAAAWAERVRSHTAAEPIVLQAGRENLAVVARWSRLPHMHAHRARHNDWSTVGLSTQEI